MRTKKLLAALLLGVGLCFVPGLGQGEVLKRLYDYRVPYMEFSLFKSKVDYIMLNPTSFLHVDFVYDKYGEVGTTLEELEFAKGIDTKEKIAIKISDTRGVFSGKSGAALLTEFKSRLEKIYLLIRVVWPRNMDTDVVAEFWSKEGDFLGYFYEGEYHLWNE